MGSISTVVDKFENISGIFNSDNLTENDLNNELLSNTVNDFILEKKGRDIIYGQNNNDTI